MREPRELAIVSDSVDCGGSERVLEAVAELYPDVPIVAAHFEGMPEPGDLASPSWAPRARLVRSPFRKRHYLAPLHARRMARVSLDGAGVVFCFSHGGWSLAADVPPGARLLCYTAGLPSALYGRRELYLRDYPPPLRALLRSAIPALRAYERALMRRPHRVLTNSHASAAAIARVHGRQADVVHPPVRTGFFTPGDGRASHALAVGRLVPPKRFDVLLEAFRQLPRERLVIAGRGPWLERLRAIAPPNVGFAGWVSDAELRDLYRSSWGLVCPSVEEFGIVMAEAHASGVPVIAPRAGGACEIVDDPATGILLERIDADSVAGAVRAVRGGRFDAAACRASAQRFSVERFVAEIEQVVEEELAMVGRVARAGRPRETAPVYGTASS